MNKTYLLLDCNFLCHRAKHATKNLSFEGKATGAIYGLLKYLSVLPEIFYTQNFVFCWDSKTSARKKIYPKYKANREDRYEQLSDEEKEFEDEFRNQMKMLRKVYLKQIGFRNIFCQKGREADDLIASVCFHSIKRKDKVIIITADKDMYQLLDTNISLYNPITNKMMTAGRFEKTYKIKSHGWTLVKALAGCPTDNIEGIKGVGEKTAIKYLKNQLNYNSKIYDTITRSANTKKYLFNFNLVELPFRETKVFKIKKDKLSVDGWKQVMKSLGMKSLKEKFPFRKKNDKSK